MTSSLSAEERAAATSTPTAPIAKPIASAAITPADVRAEVGDRRPFRGDRRGSMLTACTRRSGLTIAERCKRPGVPAPGRSPAPAARPGDRGRSSPALPRRPGTRRDAGLEIPARSGSPGFRARTNITSSCCFCVAGKPPSRCMSSDDPAVGPGLRLVRDRELVVRHGRHVDQRALHVRATGGDVEAGCDTFVVPNETCSATPVTGRGAGAPAR